MVAFSEGEYWLDSFHPRTFSSSSFTLLAISFFCSNTSSKSNFGTVALTTGSTISYQCQNEQNQVAESPGSSTISVIFHFIARSSRPQIFMKHVSTSASRMKVYWFTKNSPAHDPRLSLTIEYIRLDLLPRIRQLVKRILRCLRMTSILDRGNQRHEDIVLESHTSITKT